MDKKLEKIIDLKLDASDRDAERHGLIQYDYGQILRIHGLDLPSAVEIQFSYREKGGTTENRIGTTKDGVTEVQIPDAMLKNNGTTQDYAIWVFIYVTDETSGNTVYRIKLYVDSRPAPGEFGEDSDESHILDEAVNDVNAAADRAEQAEQNAKASEIEAGKYAASASESATAAEKKKREAIEAIQEQEETSVGKITTHTDDEIQRILNQTAEPKRELEQTITNADTSKGELDHSIETAGTSKTALDKSVGLAGTAKTELDTSTQKAGEAKTALDGSAKTAGEMQETLSATVKQAGTLDTSLGEKIETGTQLKTDLTVSGEKAVQDIQTAGSEQLGKMQAVAEEFTADREQIATNKEDIGDLKDKKITKFYASNRGENHLADSDNGKIMDMMLYGKSEQFTATGKNLLKISDGTQKTRGITVTAKDGIIALKGTATENGWVTLNIDSFVLDGTYILSSNISTVLNVFAVNKSFRSVLEQNKSAVLKNAEISRVCFTVKEGKTYDISNILVQIEQGSEATSYEPYTGGIPSPSPDYPQEIKSVMNPTIKLLGSNILKMTDGEYQKKGVTIAVSNGVVKLKGTADAQLIIVLANNIIFKEGTKIIFSPNRVKGMEEPDGAHLDLTNNVTKGFSSNNNGINIPYIIKKEDAKHSFNVQIKIPAGTNFDEIWKPQILIGETITAFEPYTEQTITLPITLNAIPVSSGGNVTIDGQQYIADRVVEKDGVFGIERNIREIHTNTKTMNNNSEEYPGWREVEGISNVTYYSGQPVGTSRKLTHISNFTQTTLQQNNIGNNNIVFLLSGVIGYSQSELIAKAIDVDMYIRLQDAIFEPLPGDIQAKLRTLVTNYPVTNISVNSEQLDGYTVFNYPISMENGWNYVKQQLGDTRDYIYDMDAKAQDIDIQSAEAYVNSEYAVALTELEV